MKLALREISWPMHEPFAISRSTQTDQPTLQVRLMADGGVIGRGEACGVDYAGETPATMTAEIRKIEGAIAAGIDRRQLLTLLPAGGARHALDAALWDIEAKRSGRTAFDLANLPARAVTSAYTIGIRDLAGYEAAARARADYPLLKVKVNASQPVAAIEAVRKGNPDARLIVDPNQSWSVAQLKELAGTMAALGADLLEQPIPVGHEAGLDGWTSPVPLCADELIDTIEDLDKAAGRFRYINIKLDKSGGLTAALALADAAEARGFGLMVGCMAGSSLSMAPGMVLAQRCAFVDLDGPMLQATDIEHGFHYRSGVVDQPCKPELWG